MLKKLIPKILGIQVNVLAVFAPQKAGKKAFDIFCKVRGGRIKEEQKELLDPAKFERLSVNDKSIQTYHWRGDGSKVLLIHGWESNTHRWWKLIADLKKFDYDIYAFDAPAHGASQGRLLNIPLYTEALEVVTNRYLPKYHIAHSIGALTSIYQFYKHQPKHVEKIVALGSASELGEIMENYRRFLTLSSKTMKALEQYILENLGFRFQEFSGAAFAKHVSVPGLIIHDKDDKITPVHASQHIHQNWINSQYIETTGLGHSLYQLEVREAVLSFIES